MSFILFNLGAASNVGGSISDAEALGRALEYALWGVFPTYKAAFLAFLNIIEEDEEQEEKVREYLNSINRLTKEDMENILERNEYKIMSAPN